MWNDKGVLNNYIPQNDFLVGGGGERSSTWQVIFKATQIRRKLDVFLHLHQHLRGLAVFSMEVSESDLAHSYLSKGQILNLSESMYSLL